MNKACLAVLVVGAGGSVAVLVVVVEGDVGVGVDLLGEPSV
jgi:hypothetical protein